MQINYEKIAIFYKKNGAFAPCRGRNLMPEFNSELINKGG